MIFRQSISKTHGQSEKCAIQEVLITGMQQWLDSKTALWWINNRGQSKQLVWQCVNEILRYSYIMFCHLGLHAAPTQGWTGILSFERFV